MKVTIPIDEAATDAFLPRNKLDGSGVGINYADAYLKPFKLTLEDGRKLLVKRRGIKITITVGEAKGEGLLRRLAFGPDPKVLLSEALREAAAQAGIGISIAPSAVELEVV